MTRYTKALSFTFLSGIVLLVCICLANLYVPLSLSPVQIGAIFLCSVPLIVCSRRFYATSKRCHRVLLLIFSFALACALILQNNIFFSGDKIDSYKINRFLGIEKIDILMLVFLIPVLCLYVSAFLNILRRLIALSASYLSRHFPSLLKPFVHRGSFVFSFLSLIASWGTFFLTFYPGTGMNDSLAILNQPIASSAQHTFLYNQYQAGLMRLGQWIGHGDIQYGAALYSVVQLCLCAAIVAYLIRWISEKGCPAFLALCIQLFFMLSPIIANISIVALKDAPFSFVLLLYIPLLSQIGETQGTCLKQHKTRNIFCALCFLTVLLRNNGLYVVIGICLYLLIVFRAQWKRMICLSLIAVLLPSCLDAAIMKWIVKQDKIFVESIAVPLQQIAMTVATDGNITHEQAEIIEKIMPQEEIRKRYTPCSVDSLKWGDGAQYLNKTYLAQNKGTFFKLWAQMLPSNLNAYIKSYLLLTYTYWSIGESSASQAYSFDWPSWDAVDITISHRQILPNRLQIPLEQYYKENMAVPSAGSLFWLILFLCLYVLCSSTSSLQKFVIFMPFIMVWVTLMISAPICNCFRYAYSLYLALPFLTCEALRPQKQ